MIATQLKLPLLALAALCMGCNGPSDGLALHHVSGSVIADGKPVPNALVVFHPKEPALNEYRPIATTDSAGEFRLATKNPDDGAPAGDYSVTVVRYVRPANIADQPDVPAPNQLPAQFANAGSTPLTATIAAGDNNLKPFELRR